MKLTHKNIDLESLKKLRNPLEKIKRENPEFLRCPDFSLRKIEEFCQKNSSYETLIVVGIGGSSLGAKAIINLLNPFSKKVLFVENIDSYELEKILSLNLDIKKTIINIISKSGKTLETRINLKILQDKFPEIKIITTSDEGSELHQESVEKNWDFFPIPKNLGGRFSVLSNVGLLPLAFAGIKVEEILKGAKQAREQFLNDSWENPLLIYSLAHFQKYSLCPNFALFSYGENFTHFNMWWRQLLGESLGKNKKIGPNPLDCIGSIDQHSLLQLFAEGPDDKIFTFLRARKKSSDITIPLISGLESLQGKPLQEVLNASQEGTCTSLAKQGKICFALEIEEITPRTTGELIMFFEIFVALLADLFQINAYNQPGVEQGKIITKKILGI